MESFDTSTSHRNLTLDDFCRLCLQQCGSRYMHPMRGRSTTFGADKVSIPEMLVYICGLPSNLTDQLPQRVCKTCINRLETAYLICRDFKEKETILDRFYLNGFVLQRLVQYEKFRFDSDGNENENEPTVEIPTASNCEMESSENATQNDTMHIRDVFSMNVSQSGMAEEEEFSNSQVSQPAPDDLSDDQPTKQEMEAFSQNSIVSLDTDYDSDESRGYQPNKPVAKPAPTKQKNVKKRETLGIPTNPAEDGNYHCVHCPRRFAQRRHYMEHLSGHRALMEERYKCPNPNCGRCFRKRDQMNRHMVNCCRSPTNATST